MKNKMLEKYRRGEQTVGTFFESGSATIMELLGLAGFDYAIIDSEHGPFEPESAMDYVRAAKLRGLTPFARVKDSSRPSILKMLDIGVEGLIIPYIHSVEEARRIVEYGKYQPVGSRGIAFCRAAGFGYEEDAADLHDYLALCNRETLLIPQCETVGAFENIEEIAGLPGIDGIFIGPFDLTGALGILGQFDSPKFWDAVNRILKACQDAGKMSIMFGTDAERCKRYLDMGFDSVTYGMEVNIFADAAIQLVEKLR